MKASLKMPIKQKKQGNIMKVLKNCIKLSCSVKIYVPSTVEVDRHFDNKEWVDKTLNFLSLKFGGSTASNSIGAWVGHNGHLVKETVTLVLSYCQQSKLESNIESVYDFCIEMKKELSQESIALEVNGEMYLL